MLSITRITSNNWIVHCISSSRSSYRWLVKLIPTTGELKEILDLRFPRGLKLDREVKACVSAHLNMRVFRLLWCGHLVAPRFEGTIVSLSFKPSFVFHLLAEERSAMPKVILRLKLSHKREVSELKIHSPLVCQKYVWHRSKLVQPLKIEEQKVW